MAEPHQGCYDTSEALASQIQDFLSKTPMRKAFSVLSFFRLVVFKMSGLIEYVAVQFIGGQDDKKCGVYPSDLVVDKASQRTEVGTIIKMKWPNNGKLYSARVIEVGEDWDFLNSTCDDFINDFNKNIPIGPGSQETIGRGPTRITTNGKPDTFRSRNW